MAINLEMPKKLQAVIDKGHQGAVEMLRPISRKYDLKEHAYPVELDTLAILFEGISAAKTISFAGAEAFRDAEGKDGNKEAKPGEGKEGGAPGEFAPSFRGGFGRGRGAPPS